MDEEIVVTATWEQVAYANGWTGPSSDYNQWCDIADHWQDVGVAGSAIGAGIATYGIVGGPQVAAFGAGMILGSTIVYGVGYFIAEYNDCN